MKLWTAVIIGFLISLPVRAAITVEPYVAQQFNPASGQVFEVPIKILEPGKINVAIYTSDGDLVRTLSGGQRDKSGIYRIAWDGKDQNNIVVPDEAYIPVVTLTTKNAIYEMDSREMSGGEEISIKSEVGSGGRIIFQLEKAARVLVRAGIKSGPLMKSILHWQVRGKGRNVVFWDGYDNDRFLRLIGTDQLALLATGFELPSHAILTIGNQNTEYNDWRKSNQWSLSMPDLSQAKFERNGRRISRHYYLPRSIDVDPGITLEIIEKLPKNKEDISVVSGPISLRVGMYEEDRWAMQQSLYEVAFFVNGQFLSEEEQGYVPLTWKWNPVGLAPGVHLVTVNVSGFNGQVGVKSLQIEIDDSESGSSQ